MKITIPHIHKIEGEAGFWASVTKTGEIKELKINVLEGLRQIEGILIGRRIKEAPLVISRVCGICPVVHILNACQALENALDVKVSDEIFLWRKLFLASQIVQSHALHLFFMSLPDFFDTSTSLSVNGEHSRTIDIESNFDLMKKFKKEAKAALEIRDFSLKITEIIGGRKVHPITPKIGGFSRMPNKEDLKKLLPRLPKILESTQILAKTFENLSYPKFQKETLFASLFSKNEYPYFQGLVKINNKKMTPADFYSNQIEECLKIPPVKRVRYLGKPYMLGAIARIKNDSRLLNPLAKKYFEEFKKKNNLSDEEFFQNIYHNLFCQMIEVLHFLEESGKLIKEILTLKTKEEKAEIKIKKGPEVEKAHYGASSGLSAMEAPRGTLFTYFEIDKKGRILNCNIVTPTAQFLANLEDDLKLILPKILKLSEEKRKRKIRALIRVYDPCISCATH